MGEREQRCTCRADRKYSPESMALVSNLTGGRSRKQSRSRADSQHKADLVGCQAARLQKGGQEWRRRAETRIERSV